MLTKAAWNATRCAGLSSFPPSRNSCPPRTCEGDVTGNRVFTRCNQIKTRSYGMRVGPKLMTGVLLRREGRPQGRRPWEDGGRDGRVASTS